MSSSTTAGARVARWSHPTSLLAAGILPTAEETPLDRQESVVSAEEEEARLFEKAGLLGESGDGLRRHSGSG